MILFNQQKRKVVIVLEKYDKLGNMSSNWKRVVGIAAKPNCAADKQMRQKIRKLFKDLGEMSDFSRNSRIGGF